MIMKKWKQMLPMVLAAAVVIGSVPPVVAKADSSKVVTLGANLSKEQKKSMYDYFGTSSGKVETIEVTNKDERKYMEGIATESQIGTRTYSCSYVEPTESGGIQVKVANLTFVTSSMIASTLTTSGVDNCNVVAASPIEVSGTGALTGIMMAYEKASGNTLDEGQKEAATEELVTTGELADDIGKEKATELMNDVKSEVIEEKLTDSGEIEETVKDAADDLNVTLTADQIAKITALMEKISQYDYDIKALKETLENLEGKEEGFFEGLWNSIKGFFTGDKNIGGIINDTKDEILGNDTVTDSTTEASDDSDKDDEPGLWDKIVAFFSNLFGGDDTDDKKDKSSDTTEDNMDDQKDNGDGQTDESDQPDDSDDQLSGGDSKSQEEDDEDIDPQENHNRLQDMEENQ